jgi:hypothetical protein
MPIGDASNSFVIHNYDISAESNSEALHLLSFHSTTDTYWS